jgi:outer membrane protein, multidrug efflux system
MCRPWVVLLVVLSGCVPTLVNAPRAAKTTVPQAFPGQGAAPSSAHVEWRAFFDDARLVALVDEALKNNQELNLVALEIELAKNEIGAREGEVFPKLNARVGAGVEKVGRYTSQGVGDAAAGLPEHLPDFALGLFATWEVDIWGKLRNATKAATTRYLASVEGRNFTVTVLVSEIATTWYELLALDAQLDVLEQNVALQKDALENVRVQKEAARVTELAVKRFEAEVLKNESRTFAIRQRIVQTENRLNFLVGRFPQHVERDATAFSKVVPAAVHTGLPSELLENRPDVRQAELEVAAAELDVQVARASFFPSLGIRAGLGVQSFDVLRLVTTPASLLYNLAGDVMAPLINRQAITASYFSANTRQMQAVWKLERAILQGYGEAATQLAAIENLEKSYALRSRAVETLNESTTIATSLFSSARADYVEVLLTRRESLESQMELIETKQQELSAVVSLYRALGGGWR